ncbi:ribonuclease Z [Rubripirellula amarantea]|uniref:Ribonuclease Z n=1 Tax=Rubripirellula amarantea TaxID=2527999 RepID=A0A5C5WFL6_9BACT|nr:MBL fold metallo-hydrolase [Rubripirellula amarantea]TWT49327.1 ribonuclease Z [Rubripirellula amarantea]
MQIHCLGTVGYHPNDTRHTSCYFLPKSGILLDGGSGMFRLRKHIETESLDILLSHAHLDHILGLTFLLDVLHESSVKKIRIWGEATKLQAVQDHLFHPLIFPMPLECEWNPIDDLESFTINDAEITFRHQEHPGGSIAYRIDWQSPRKRLVYATDTTGDLSDEHAHWSQDADLLMHECYFRDEASHWALRTGHCWTSRVAQVAAKSKPKQLLLTHINPIETRDDPIDIASIRRQIECKAILAEDEMLVEF